MAARTAFEPLVSVVNYDITSSDDELSEIESANGQAFVYASCYLPAPEFPGQSSENDSATESDSGQDTKTAPHITEPEGGALLPLSASIPVEKLHERLDQSPRAARRTLKISTSEEENQTASPSAKMIKAQVVEISSSSESEEEAVPKEVAGNKRRPYALKTAALPTEMRGFMAASRRFHTRAHSLERSTAGVSTSTYAKAEERMLCFLGYAKEKDRQSSLTPHTFADARLIENYLDYLREERELCPATISNHVSSLLYPLKYLFRKDSPRFDGMPLIGQLRRTATILQRQGEVDRPKTIEELQALNRWLHWDEVLDALAMQRFRFEAARSKKHRAREALDLLLLSLYCHIPPSRGMEIRTLEIVQEGELDHPFSAGEFRYRNIVLVKSSGAVTIHIQLYKTRRFTGHEQIDLQVDSELCRLVRQYVQEFRPEMGPGSHLFLNASGQPFSSSAFSRHIKGLLMRLTGCAVSINGLRSAFLTWAYSQSECTDQMKDSLAAALRHSREQAQSTYDRRTANQKKALALGLARSRAEQQEGEERAPAQDDETTSQHEVGDFVGLVEEESSLQQPRVLLGRLHSFLPSGQASLLWYKCVGGGLYCLEVDGSQWVESVSSLVPVKVKPAKGKTNCYRLCTSLRTIHKAVHDSRSS